MALIALCAFIVFSSAGCHSLEAAVAIIGGSVELMASESCTDEGFRLMTNDSRVTVATFVNGAWRPEELYKDRIAHSSSSSVVLTSVRYNDNHLYEFYCNANVVTRIQLEVVIPDHESVTEGEQVRLKCYSQTRRKSVKFIKWEKDGKLVFKQERASGLISYGTGFEGRNLSVSSYWNLTGDLSLTMESVRTEDRGVYMCYTGEEDGGTRRGTPAVRMEVTERIPEQNTAPTKRPTQKPPEGNGVSGMNVLIIVMVAIGEAVVFLIAGLAAHYWFRIHRSYGPDVENPDDDMQLRPINVSGDVNGRPPRIN